MARINKLITLLVCIIMSLCLASRGFSTIKIGAAISLSGRYKKPGTMIYLGYKLWEKQVNNRGGLLGKEVELITYDDQSDADRSVALYKKLIEKDGVDLVLSPYSTSITYRVSSLTEKYHYPLLAAGASGPQLWERGYKYLFGMYALADRYFTGFLDIIAEYGFKNVVTIVENNQFPLSAADGVEKWGERFGLKILKKIVYSDGNENFEEILRTVKKLNPDAIVLCAYPKDVYRFMASMKHLRYRPRAFAATIAPAFKEFGVKLGKDAEGVFGPSQWEANARIPFPGTRKFIRDFKEFAKSTPTYHAASGYAACEILEKSINRAGSLDRELIASVIRQMDTFTVLGRFKVDARGVQIGHNPITIQWQKGKREIVWPRKMQTSNPIFPELYKQE